MKYIFFILCLLLASVTVQAQMILKSGNSVIDNEVEAAAQAIDEATIPDIEGDDDKKKDPKKIVKPSVPLTPSTPPPNVKRVVKKLPPIEAQRSIQDERIDDAYVQGLIQRTYDFIENK